MGAGKTTIGKQLANKLKYNFIDLDQFIEESNQTSISSIFSDKGESYFRDIESRHLKKVLEFLGQNPPMDNKMLDYQHLTMVSFKIIKDVKKMREIVIMM